MILILWLWCATIGIALLLSGIVLDKDPITKVMLLGLDIPFLIVAAFYSMQIRIAGAGDSAIVSTTYYYPQFAVLFTVLIGITAMLIIQQAFSGLAETVKEL